MPGRDYQTIRSRLTKMAHNARNSDGDFADAVRVSPAYSAHVT